MTLLVGKMIKIGSRVEKNEKKIMTSMKEIIFYLAVAVTFSQLGDFKC